MIKDSSYQQKFILIQPWLVSIIEKIKKDLKNEHLRIDKNFCRKYFLGKNPNQVQPEDMAPAYIKDIAEGNVGLGEFIASRWLLKNTEIYNFFEEKLKTINPEFDQIQVLSQDQSLDIVQQSSQQFGVVNTYIFSVFNEVAFTDTVFEQLKQKAEQTTNQIEAEQIEHEALHTVEALKKRHAREISTLTDRVEKKMLGLQKKYINDVDALKKQIIFLQRKLNELQVEVGN